MDKLKEFVDDHKAGIKTGKYPNYLSDVNINDDAVLTFAVYGRKKDDLGNIVKREIIDSTRGTYWVPDVQK